MQYHDHVGEPVDRGLSAGAIGLQVCLALVAVFSNSACDRTGSPDLELSRLRTAERIIEIEPPEHFSSDSLYSTRPMVVWGFESEEDLEDWKIDSAEHRLARSGRLELHPSDKNLGRMQRTVDLAASKVGAFEIVGEGLGQGEVFVSWKTAETRFSKGRRIKAKSEKGGKLTFATRGHRLWRGDISTLRFDFWTRAEEIIIHEVTALELIPREEEIARARETPWKVDLGAEVREAVWTPAEAPWLWRVEVPPGPSQLDFGYGVQKPFSTATFTVQITSESKSRLVFRDDVVAGEGGKSPHLWHEATLDLSALAGKTIEIEFSASQSDDSEPGLLAFWAEPRIRTDAGEGRPPNIVLISVDTLRADHLSLYGYDRKTSPFLDAWAQRNAVVFEKVVAPSPWTLPSHVTLFTGLDALAHGLNYEDAVPDHLPLLAQKLRAVGYRTMAITGGGFLHPRYGLGRGFNVYSHWSPGSGTGQFFAELDNGIERALEWLQPPTEEPFFLFFHTYEVHSPYRSRESRSSELTVADDESFAISTTSDPQGPAGGFRVSKKMIREDDRSDLSPEFFPLAVDLYDEGVTYTDERLGRLFQLLEDSGSLNDTIVVLTSDHGEGLGERDLAGHAYLYDFNILVPLVISAPDLPKAGRFVPDQVRLADVTPTILELASLPIPPDLSGVSLVPLLFGADQGWQPLPAWSYAASSNFGLSLRLPNGLKLIHQNSGWQPIAGGSELYKLDTDPQELDNLALGSSDSARLTQQLLARYSNEIPGLRVRFSNSGSEEGFVALMRGQLATPLRVKTADLVPPLEWKAGQVKVTVPPYSDFTILLEGPTYRPVDLTLLEALGGGNLQRTLQLEDVTSPWQIEMRHGVWGESRPLESEAPFNGVRIWWQGDTSLASGTDQLLDEELAERLRALGYIQ